MFNRAQGTIEYLVIIAIVVVISLVVVGLLMNQVGSSENISKSSSKISGLAQSIGITESLVEPVDGNFVLRLLNNSGDSITVSNVKIGDTNVSFSEDLAQSGSKFFRLDTNVVCQQGKVVSEDVVVTYVTANGLTKTQRLNDKVMFDCTPYMIEQANLADQCPDCEVCTVLDGNASSSQVLGGYTFFSSSSTKQNGSLLRYANLGTGQTNCWDVSGSVISCSDAGYPGMDGNVYGSSYVHSWGSATAGTILDLNSGLRWQIADNGSGVIWQGALQYCDALSLDGYTDWHLPNFKEISDMYDYQAGTCYAVFSGCNNYWSSTTVPSLPVHAYNLFTAYGYVYNDDVYDWKDAANFYARCVRFEN